MIDLVTYLLTKAYVDNAVADIEAGVILDYVIVDTLPDIGDANTVYLIHKKDDTYDEYVYRKGTYDKVKEGVINSFLLKGYLYADKFWKDAGHNTRLPDSVQRVYLDIPSRELYYFNTQTQKYEKFIKTATEDEPGIMKLYKDSGENEDGTMTQKSITRKLKKKVEVNLEKLSTDEELGLELNKA